MAALYDTTGATYTTTRRPDPRIARRISAALRDATSVVDVGAGTGSYEPPTTVLAIEPSRTMITQRPPRSAPAVQGVAERLPLGHDSVDAALAVLTIHHWSDVAAGLAELRRVARRRVVVLTWDATVFSDFWLLRSYLPAAARTDARLAVPIDAVVDALPGAWVSAVPVPHDCVDGFGGAWWRRPEAYLDATVRAGMSMLALTPPEELEAGLARLATDLADGTWRREQAQLLELEELDLGYRLVTCEL